MTTRSFIYTGDGVRTSFPVEFPYINKSHVKVAVDGGVVTNYTWSSPSNIVFAAAPTGVVRVYGETPVNPLVDFQTDVIAPSQVDIATRQAIYLSVEASDRFGSVGGRSYYLDDFDNLFDGTATTFPLKYQNSQASAGILIADGSGWFVVSINGLLQDPRTAYTVTKGTSPTITFSSPPGAGDNCTINFIKLVDAGSGSGGGGSGGGSGGSGGSGGTPVDVGTGAPENPVEGQVWFDTSTKTIKIWTDGAWVTYEWFPEIPPSGVTVGPAAPSNPQPGYVWFDEVSGKIKIFDNGQWVEYEWRPQIPPAGVRVGAALPGTANNGEVFFNTTDNQIYFRENGAWVAYSWGTTGNAEILTVIDQANLPAGAGVGQLAFVTSQNKLYVKATTGWTSDFGTADLGPGSVTSATIAAGAVIADKIAANAVTAVKIAANTITGDKIAAATISALNLQAGSVTADKVAADAITGNKIAASTITGDKIAGFTISAANLQAGAVTADKIQAGAISGDKIAASTITGDKLAINSITANRIQTNTLILGTENLTAGAVSNTTWTRAGLGYLGPQSFIVCASLVITATPGAKRIIDISYSHANDYYGVPNPVGPYGIDPFNSQAQIQINGSAVAESGMTVLGGTASHAFTYIDEVSRSGAVTISLAIQWSAPTSRPGTTVRWPTIVVTELKR